jgi:hypothetical protein
MTTLAGAVLLVGRILLAGLFAFSARGHIQGHARYVGVAEGKLPTQEGSFYRNVTLLGAALSLFALLTAVGHLRFALTGAAISLR